jgi:hypothetical protein
MDFIKRNYEKILLCAVLLGLVGALVMMGFLIEMDKQKSQDVKNNLIGGKIQPLPELNFIRQTNVMERLGSESDLDFSTTNRLFNPVQWQKDVNGNLIKIKTGHEVGAEAATVTKITPLNFIISLDSVMTNEAAPRYVFSVENNAAAIPAQRRPQHHYASVGEKNAVFTVVTNTGPAENPEQIILKLSGGETVTVSKDKPFQRVDGYSADLKYDPEGLKWAARRVGMDLKFAGDDYNIVAIHQNEVILSAQSNQKRTPLPYAP